MVRPKFILHFLVDLVFFLGFYGPMVCVFLPVFKFRFQQVLSVSEQVVDHVLPSSYFELFPVVDVNVGTIERLYAHVVVFGMGRIEMHSLEDLGSLRR